MSSNRYTCRVCLQHLALVAVDRLPEAEEEEDQGGPDLGEVREGPQRRVVGVERRVAACRAACCERPHHRAPRRAPPRVLGPRVSVRAARVPRHLLSCAPMRRYLALFTMRRYTAVYLLSYWIPGKVSFCGFPNFHSEDSESAKMCFCKHPHILTLNPHTCIL